jgi:2-oxoglutarate ferredoxin oxidoreductase subunit beta
MRAYERFIRFETFPQPWCPGCGDGIILKSIAMAFADLEKNPDDIIVVAGIGCSGRMAAYFKTNTLHTTHGRALTFATGIKLAQPEKLVVVVSGDGDALAIGGNHLIHAARRNIGIKMILINNGVYGMTGGQLSPMTPQMFLTATTPYQNIEPRFDIANLLIASHVSFLARETVNRPYPLKEVIRKSMLHPGFSVVEAISNCHVNLGRKNKMKSALTMTKWIAEKTVGKEEHAKLTPEEKEHKYPVGILQADTERLEYSALYHKIVAAAVESESGRETSS